MTELNTSNLNEQQLAELNQVLEELASRRKYRKLDFAFPDTGDYPRWKYPHAMKFFEAGKEYKQRLMIAANRIGKTYACAYEMALHLTGLYPEWWKGKRFNQI